MPATTPPAIAPPCPLPPDPDEPPLGGAAAGIGDGAPAEVPTVLCTATNSEPGGGGADGGGFDADGVAFGASGNGADDFAVAGAREVDPGPGAGAGDVGPVVELGIGGGGAPGGPFAPAPLIADSMAGTAGCAEADEDSARSSKNAGTPSVMVPQVQQLPNASRIWIQSRAAPH